MGVEARGWSVRAKGVRGSKGRGKGEEEGGVEDEQEVS